MTFIKEKIPEQYWDKLKRLGFDENIYYASWLADYKRGIFSWFIFPKEQDRDDYTIYWTILWKERRVVVRELVVDSTWPVWNDENVLLKKGLVIIDIVEIVAYGVLPEENNELLVVTQEITQARNPDYAIQFRNIAEPEFNGG